MTPDIEEEKRPLTPLLIAGGLLLLLILVIIGLRQEASQLTSESFNGNYLGFLFLINGNIILVMVLGFLVIKNVAKLLLDRRRGLLGARLRTRLVVAFVSLALGPTIFLFLISRGIINSVFQYWFSPQVTSAVDGALAIARFHYDGLEKNSRDRSGIFAERLTGLLPLLVDADSVVGGQTELSVLRQEKRALLEKFLREKSRELNFAESTILRVDGSLVARYLDEGKLPIGRYLEPQRVSFREAGQGIATTRPERSRFGDLIRSYVPIKFGDQTSYILLTSSVETNELGELLSRVLDAYEDYRELRTYRIPLTSTYLLTLVVVSLMIVFAAVWIGFYLARSISGPIQALAEGTQEIAKGNLNHRIPDIGIDELSMLVSSFNKMTHDLSLTTWELEERRKYMETVLESIESGVLSIDAEGKVLTCNRAAQEILLVEGNPVGKMVDGLGSEELSNAIETLLPLQDAKETISLFRKGRTRYLQVSLTQLHFGSNKKKEGAVVVLDDLTEQVQAQKTFAWQEVARRMAHEIKNPLTPIQLSAERIQRRLLTSSDLSSTNKELISETTETITRSVDTLRNLVSEFSRFARLPKARLDSLPVVEIVKNIITIFSESHSNIAFPYEFASNDIKALGDREQLEAVLTNLFENASQAIERSKILEPVIMTRVSVDGEEVIFEVSDNGCGVPDTDKPKLFEPYFSTRKGGTGLGLAIVSSIIADHGGVITVSDNKPRGAVFTFSLQKAG